MSCQKKKSVEPLLILSRSHCPGVFIFDLYIKTGFEHIKKFLNSN